MSGWTTEAQQRWEQIPASKRELILNRVWCPHCGELRRIELDGGTLVAGDLVLAGSCTVCGHRAARLLEYEPHPMPPLADQPFLPGESVIWLKRLPGGPYVVPLSATVLAVTPRALAVAIPKDTAIVPSVPSLLTYTE